MNGSVNIELKVEMMFVLCTRGHSRKSFVELPNFTDRSEKDSPKKYLHSIHIKIFIGWQKHVAVRSVMENVYQNLL